MKKIVREVIALIILLIAIMLMIVMFFFDYIKSDSNQPQAATYQMTENELQILKEKDDYSNSQEDKIVLQNGYTVTEEELSGYKASGELKTGQSNPFDETAVTGVLYDAEGNAYYKVIAGKNEAQTSSTWYGTVSGNSVAPSQTSVPTQAVKTPAPTVTPIPTPTATPTPTPTPTQAYNPDTDITAPSSDSGNLSQVTGRK